MTYFDRLRDLEDYEESERVLAKAVASLTAFRMMKRTEYFSAKEYDQTVVIRMRTVDAPTDVLRRAIEIARSTGYATVDDDDGCPVTVEVWEE